MRNPASLSYLECEGSRNLGRRKVTEITFIAQAEWDCMAIAG